MCVYIYIYIFDQLTIIYYIFYNYTEILLLELFIELKSINIVTNTFTNVPHPRKSL